jgi:hypothetical protein
MTTLTFHHCGGEVFWSPGGPLALVTPAMAIDLTAALTQEGIDGALAGDVDHIRRATRLLNELGTATRAARMWREAGRVSV